MNTITEVRLHSRPVALVRPFVTAVRTATAIDALIVEVVDSDGRSGWGEAPTSWRVTGESPASVTAAVEGPLREAVVGMPVDPSGATESAAGTAALASASEASAALEAAVVRNSAARMAVDCAIYDLAAQAAGVPLYELLGASAYAGSTGVRTDMTLSAVVDAAGIAGLVEAAIEHRDAGFRTIKVKVGAGGDDIAAMRAVRDAVGTAVTLRADANQGWTPERAVDVIRGWEDAGLGVELVEQPVHRDDLDGLAFVTAHVGTPLLADESVWTTRDAREVIARRAADMVNIKLAKTGGIREAIALRDLARAAGVSVIVGCMMESHVGIAAASAVAASVNAQSGAPTAHDLDAGLWLSASPVRGGIRYDRDTVRIPDAPGLGIDGLVV
ncbi:dipeptide epimerase [Planctomonas sp. JC2975]|uniref:dipeptide epimerase n=1 Tax=Planctomonas sp. JC2975 TaxID=2729626 RepID=UPI0014734ED7|nr:dipeptide epimerase [Planctomonas sp. JC2975]NNC13539.1 dipeptide epimerase [Planctomonas sp. JC2975]